MHVGLNAWFPPDATQRHSLCACKWRRCITQEKYMNKHATNARKEAYATRASDARDATVKTVRRLAASVVYSCVACVAWKPSFMHNGWRAPAAAVCKSVPRTWADKTHAHTVTASQAQAFTESHLHKTVPRSCLSVAITCPSGAVFEKCVEKNLHISWFAVNLRRCTNVFPLSEVAYTSWLRRSVIPR